METSLVKINRFFTLKRLAEILAYVIIRYDETRRPVLAKEIAEYYKISDKQVLGYVGELEDLEYVDRPEETCPKPISPTREGRKWYNDKISAFILRGEQTLIKRHSLLE